MRALLLAAALLLSFVSAKAQSHALAQASDAKPQVNVTVNLTEGDPIKGKLIKADGESVVVEVGAGEITIKPSKVVSILFQPADEQTQTEKPPEKRKDVVAAEKVLSALRKLDNAVEVTVTFQGYSQLLIESKTTIDENLSDVSDPTFRSEVQQAIIDYQYAMAVWNVAVANGWTYFNSKQEPGRTLIQRYGVPVKISIWTQVPVMNALSYVWLSARRHFNSAVVIEKQLGETPKS